jgi:glycerate 2-kinase
MTDTGPVSPIPGVRDTVLVAPDSFKGTFSATQVAEAVGAGLRAAGRPVDLCPVADGGEGTLEALRPAFGGELRTVRVHGPLGRAMDGAFLLSEDGRTAIVETATASGLHLVPRRRRDPFAASTVGTGELIAAAVAAGVQTILLGVGGSATTDGGTGAIDAIERAGGLREARLVVLCDVRTVFEDAARVFGPQKGADPDAVKRLTARLHRQARRLPRDPRGIEMTGGAGGLSGGLWAAFGAELVGGAAFVLDAVDFDRRMLAARAVITGEGKLDGQSLVGKLVAEIATRARQRGVPCDAVCGVRELDAMGARMLDLERIVEATTLDELERAGRELAVVI